MTTGQIIGVIVGVILIFLWLGNFRGSGLTFGSAAKMALAWVGIFAALFVIFLFRDDMSNVWDRAKAEITGSAVASSGGAMRLRKDEDGHFWVTATVNDQPVRFMIDSGATNTTVSKETARRAGIKFPDEAQAEEVDTANGVIKVLPSMVASFRVGEIQRDGLGVDILPAEDDTNLLGMNFLSSLSRWRVEGDQMILEP
jgi:aspartyl protease family protein